jgi:uncharacterized protein (TIGR03083 family)
VTGLPYLDHIRMQTDAFLKSIEERFEKPVPSCPGWNGGDLAVHVWEALHFWGEVAETRAQDKTGLVEPTYPAPDEVLEFVELACQRLIRVLRYRHGDEPIYSWSSNKTISFIPRRMAHEMSVHRWDAEATAGDPISALDEPMAADGVDEFMEHFFGVDMTWDGPGQRVILRSDEGDWELEGGDAPDVPAAEVSGSSSDLFLGLWRRVSLDSLDVKGDRAAAERLFAWTDLT